MLSDSQSSDTEMQSLTEERPSAGWVQQHRSETSSTDMQSSVPIICSGDDKRVS